MIVFHEGGDFLFRLLVVEPPINGAERRQFDVSFRPADDDGGVEAFINGGSRCAADGCEDAIGIADECRRIVLRLDDAFVGHVVALCDNACRSPKEVVDKINEMNDLRDEYTSAFAIPFAMPVVAVVSIGAEATEIDGGIENLSETTAIQQLLQQKIGLLMTMLEDAGEDKFGMLFMGGEHGVQSFQRIGQAFFADDVLACIHGGDGKRRMAGMIRANVDEIDFRIVQHVREVFREIGHAKLGGHGGRLVSFDVTDCFNGGAWNLLVAVDMGRGDSTATDKADFYLFHAWPPRGCSVVWKNQMRRNTNIK